METNLEKPSNPRMSNPEGVYASEARLEDCVTLRDEIAMRAMQGYLSSEYGILHSSDKHNDAMLCIRFYEFADAMLEARSLETKS